jgi:hypothetical protein
MSFKVATIQITTLLVVVLIMAWVLISLMDDRLNLAIVNETGAPISKFVVRYKKQYCSVTMLLPTEIIGCTLSSDGNNKISIYGRINDEPYILEDIGVVESGSSVRNYVKLKPENNYEINSKLVIN